MKLTSLQLLICAALAASLVADEIRLKDGRVLIGRIEKPAKGNDKDPMVEIQTRDGTVRVQASEIESTRTDKELRESLAKMAQGVPKTPFAALQLAVQARNWGLDAELWHYLDLAVTVPRDSKNQGLRGRVDDFLAQLEPELLARKHRTAKTPERVKELLAQLGKDAGPGRTAAVEELLVRESNADADLRLEARRNAEASRRSCAISALARRNNKGNDTFVYRSTVLDPSEAVRERAAVIAREHFDTGAAIKYLTPGLMASVPELRVRTGEAFANLGDPAAIKVLVAAGPNANKALANSDPGMRAHCAFIEQTAYVRDFDVEVAQAAAIADPKIGVLQSGVVLDVTVHAVIEEHIRIVGAWRNALRRLAGSDPGARPIDWAAWLQSQQSLQPPTAAPSVPTTAPVTPTKTAPAGGK
jgi:hypothetical protein